MRNSLYFFGAMILSTLLLSCSTLQNSGQEYILKFKSEKGRMEKLRVRHVSMKKQTGTDQISRNEIESVDFTVEAETKEVNLEKGTFSQKQKVTEKEGEEIELHDMGFPEIGEEILFEYDSNAKVLKAGEYPQRSVFFVPPVSLPKGPVKVGNTWELKASWVNARSGIEMNLDLVTIFKRVISCGDGECADLEISGEVKVPALSKMAKASFLLSGRVLFSIDKGMVVWQELRNREKLHFANGDGMEVESCFKIISTQTEIDFLEKADLGCVAPFEVRVDMPI